MNGWLKYNGFDTDASYRFAAVLSTAIVVLMLCQSPQPTAAAAAAIFGVRRDTAAAARSSLGGERWEHPCDAEAESETVDSHESMPASNADDFAGLSSRIASMKNAVGILKNEYVAARFNNDASSIEASIDFNSPNSIAPNWNLTNFNDNETLKLCYGNLARLAVLTNLTRQGEEASVMTPNFADSFRTLEDESYRGLYVIMCELSTVMNRLGVTLMSAETKAAIEAISLETPPNEAARHVRDYYVMRLLEISADKLIAVFDRLAGRTA